MNERAAVQSQILASDPWFLERAAILEREARRIRAQGFGPVADRIEAIVARIRDPDLNATPFLYN